jgi:hypothetical protein
VKTISEISRHIYIYQRTTASNGNNYVLFHFIKLLNLNLITSLEYESVSAALSSSFLVIKLETCALSLAVDSSCSEPQDTFLDCNLRRDEGFRFQPNIVYSACESHCFGERACHPSNIWGETYWEFISSQHSFL